jgi:LacI family transcriptional regulator
MKGKVGLKDVADALNISQSTVSRALRNKPGVSPELREKVFKVAQDLNYSFKLLKEQSFRKVGIVIPDIANPFFATVCYGIESILRSNGYLTYLINTDEDMELECDYVRSFIEDESLEGLVVAPSADTEEFYEKLQGTLPVVFFDRHYESLAIPSVLVDNKDVIFRATQYLVSLGHKSIAFIAGDHDLYTGRTRTEGFKEAVQLLGLDKNSCPIVSGNFRKSEAYEVTRGIFGRNSCTAVIASSNKTTSGVLHAIRELGLAVPRDVSIIGFDDQEWMEYSDPPLTTMVQPAFTMGILAANMLLQQINGTSLQEHVVLKAEIKKRGSEGPHGS